MPVTLNRRNGAHAVVRPGWARCIAATLLIPAFASAGPWISPGDEELRHHLQILADAQILSTPVTTWPVMWSSIKQDLNSSSRREIPDALLWSLQYVRFALNQQTSGALHGNARADVGNSVEALRGFSADRRESAELGASLDLLGNIFAAHLEGTLADSPSDGNTARPDGTYVAAILGNWAFSAGWQDRWWGPGWQSSLILSSNARPVPALALQRNNTEAFATPWLSWLGPWQFTTFIGELESSATIPNAKLIGGRLTLKPFKSFEMGFSRTAQWGGDGRPQSAHSLWDMITGRDNSGSGGINSNNEPGNQLAGLDGRWSFPVGLTRNAFYGQIIGEDESGGLPSRNMYLAGLESAFNSGHWSHRLMLEGATTVADRFHGGRFNYAYEHGIYRDGYRYEGRPLGAAFDNDSDSLTLSGEHFRDNGQQLSWSISHLNLNIDNSNRAGAGGNVFGADETQLIHARASYGIPFAKSWKMTVGGEIYNHHLLLGSEDISSGVFAKVELKL